MQTTSFLFLNFQKFEGTEWDLFRAGVVDIDEQTVQTTHQPKELCTKIDNVASRLKEMINSGDQQLSSGVTKFIAKFDKLSTPRMRPKLSNERQKIRHYRARSTEEEE